MTLAAALVALPLALASGYHIDLPAGWDYDREAATALASRLLQERHYDGLRVDLGADAYISSDGGLLYVTWVHASEPADEPELRVRRAFDGMRRGPAAAAADGTAELVSWKEDVRDSLAAGELEWRHSSNQTVTLVRALLWVSPDRHLRQVRAECVMRADRVEALRPACARTLASLTTTVPAAERGSLGAVPASGELRLAAPGGDAGAMLLVVESGDDTSGQASLRAPTEGGVLYQEPERRESGPDRRLLLVGGAILLAVAVYFTTRRRPGPDPRDEDSAP